MPLTTPLLSVLVLLVGAIGLPLTRRIKRPQARDGLALFVASSFLLLLYSLYRERPTSASIPLWQAISPFGVQLGYYVDSLSLLFASLIGLILLVVTLAQTLFVTSDDQGAYSYAVTFLVAAGGTSLVFAGDLVTLYLSWGFLDLGLLVLTGFVHRGRAASRTGLRLLTVAYLAGLALLASLLLLERQGASFSLQATLLPSTVISLMFFAALARLGLYPALVALPPDVEMSLLALAAWYVVPLSAGGYLLARVLAQAAATTLLGGQVALFLGSLALILGPFPLWFKTDLRNSAPYIVLNQVGYLALVGAVVGADSVAVASTQVIGMTLALTLLLLSHGARGRLVRRPYRLWAQSCAFVGVASLAGAPFTVGFLSRWLLYQSLWEARLAPVLALGLAANSFLLAPLLKMCLESSPQAGAQRRTAPLFLGGMTAIAVPLVILGLHPPLIGRLLGVQAMASPLPALPDLLYSTQPAFTLLMLAGTLLSLGLGYLLYYKGERIVASAGIALGTLQAVAELGWLYRALPWVVQRLALILEELGRFFEERHSAGWILLFSLLVTLLLLSS